MSGKLVVTTYDKWIHDENLKQIYYLDEYKEPSLCYYMVFQYDDISFISPGDGWLDICTTDKKRHTIHGGTIITYDRFLSEFGGYLDKQDVLKGRFEKCKDALSKINPIRQYAWDKIHEICKQKFDKEAYIEKFKELFYNIIKQLSDLNMDIPYYGEGRTYHEKYGGDIKKLSPSFRINRKNGKRNVIMNDDAKTVLSLIQTNKNIINDTINGW